MTVYLSSGDARLELLPAAGGSVGRFSRRGHDILRSAPTGASAALNTGAFPLVPYCNRIPNGDFTFEGRNVHIAPNMPPQRHPLHGQGWLAPWTIESAAEDEAVLSFDHPASEWPWSYRAVQTFQLSPDGLRIDLSVTNMSDEDMPAGLGFHPYFHAPRGTTLKAHVEGAWMIDDEILPTVHRDGPFGADWSRGANVALPDLIDHCYTGWDQTAVLRQPEVTVTMTAPAKARWLHLYIPPDEDYLCIEPVTNRPDPFGGTDSGIVTLSPGETLTTWMKIDLE